MPLWKKHTANIVKQQLHEFWLKQIACLRSGSTDSTAGGAAAKKVACSSVHEDSSDGSDDCARTQPTEAVPAVALGLVTDHAGTNTTAAKDDLTNQATAVELCTAGSETAAAAETKLDVNLEDKEAVRAASLLQVVESLSVAMGKHYLSELLPTTATYTGANQDTTEKTGVGFDGEKRAKWLQEMLGASSMGTACEQLALFKLAAQHR